MPDRYRPKPTSSLPMPPVTSETRWRPSARWPTYEVSDAGHVRLTSKASVASGRPRRPLAWHSRIPGSGQAYVNITVASGRSQRVGVVALVQEVWGASHPCGAIGQATPSLESTPTTAPVVNAPVSGARNRPGPGDSMREVAFEHFAAGGTSADLAVLCGIPRATAYSYHTQYRQDIGDDTCYHPEAKAAQLRRVLAGPARQASDEDGPLTAYEVYGGKGFCTQVYRDLGIRVTSRAHADGNDLAMTSAELASGRQYDVVDIDGFGGPGRLLFRGILDLLRPRGWLFVTVPSNDLIRGSAVTMNMNRICFGAASPQTVDYLRTIKQLGLLSLRSITLADIQFLEDAGRVRMTRYAFEARRVSALDLHDQFAASRPKGGLVPPAATTVESVLRAEA